MGASATLLRLSAWLEGGELPVTGVHPGRGAEGDPPRPSMLPALGWGWPARGETPWYSPAGLASIMQRLLIKYDNLFEVSFPYSMGWHGEWHGWGTPATLSSTFPVPSLGLMQWLHPWQEPPRAPTWRRTVGTGSSMPTTTPRCSALPPSASSWLATRCWRRLSGTSPRSR